MSSKTEVKAPGIKYTFEELCHAEKRLQAPYDIIRAALMEKKIESATISEAQKIVAEFKTREVKH